MRTQLDQRIDQQTYQLQSQRSNDEAHREVGQVELVHKMEQRRIADDGHDIRHIALLAMAQMAMPPAVELAIQEYHQSRKQGGERIYEANDDELVLPRQKSQMAEAKDQHERQHRQVERICQPRNLASREEE